MKEKSKYPGSSYLKWREQKKEFSKRSYTCSCHSASLQPPYFVAMAALGVASIPYAFFIYFRFREVLWKNLQNHGIIPLLENYNERKLQKTLENSNRPRHEQERPHPPGKNHQQHRSKNEQRRRRFHGKLTENMHRLGLRDWRYYGSECGYGRVKNE